jgi:hypothetical protein
MRIIKTLLLVSSLFLSSSVLADITGMTTPPAGGNTQIQFNKRGAFGADPLFTYSTSTKNMTVSTVTASKLIISTISVSTLQVTGLAPGVMMIVGTSSQVVTNSVSLSTQVSSRLPLSMLQSTGSFILTGGTIAYTAAHSSGTVFDTSTRTFQGGGFAGTRNDSSTMTAIGQVINGTKTDNSTTTYTGANTFTYEEVQQIRNFAGTVRHLIKNTNTGTSGLTRIELDNGLNTFDIDLFGIGNSSTFDGISLSSFTRFRNGSTLAGMAFVNAGAFPIILGTNDTTVMRLSGAGEITQPLQPSFLVTNSAGATDVTGDGTQYTVLWGNEIFDQGSDFASNTFTAPVTGRYSLSVSVTLLNVLSSHTELALTLTTSNRNYNFERDEALAKGAPTLTATVIADMDAGDTATVTIIGVNGTKTIDVIANGAYNYFSGSLIN